MKIRNLLLAAVLVALVASSLVANQLALRKPPDLAFQDPAGKEILLSSLRGKVIAIEFFFVRSPHCLSLVQMLNRLQAELGPRGFQSVAIAFGPNSDGGVLTNLVESFKLSYPIGSTTSDKVDVFLGRREKEILKIPQIVIIDRNGFVRAASGTKGDQSLENESSLRLLLTPLLNEAPAAQSAGQLGPAHKS